MSKKKYHILLSVLVVVFAGGAATAGILFVRDNAKDLIPPEIYKKLTFQPYLASESGEMVIDQASIKYDSSEKGLSYIANSSAFGKLTVSQQSTPKEFIDIPDYYTKLVDRLNRYSVFQNQTGTVYLTKPGDQPAGQTAVMNAGGVLMFVRSDKDISDDQWKRIFNNLQQS